MNDKWLLHWIVVMELMYNVSWKGLITLGPTLTLGHLFRMFLC